MGFQESLQKVARINRVFPDETQFRPYIPDKGGTRASFTARLPDLNPPTCDPQAEHRS